MKAYYFAQNDNKLRYGDNREITIGKMHTVKDTPKLCEKGLHGSVKALDALKYAPGNMLYIVDITRKLDICEDKICGQRRKYLAGFNAESLLFEFARKQALINIENIKPYTKDYTLIVEYLTTGNDNLKYAAWSAAWSSAKSAALSAYAYAAESAAWSAAWSSDKSAALSADAYAAESAAWSAAKSASESAAWYVAKFAAAYATESAAESAAWSAALSASWPAAKSAAESAAKSDANNMLEQMINDKQKDMQNV